jgi:hypothetical protein
VNREDIIGIFNKSRISEGKSSDFFTMTFEDIERFAGLAAEREREECAKLLDEMAAKDKLTNYYKVAALAMRARGNN